MRFGNTGGSACVRIVGVGWGFWPLAFECGRDTGGEMGHSVAPVAPCREETQNREKGGEQPPLALPREGWQAGLSPTLLEYVCITEQKPCEYRLCCLAAKGQGRWRK